MASVRHRLLVATPELIDPNFFRSVVLVVEHNAEGAFGLVLNRPTRARFDGTLGAWVELAARPAVVFIGGPVQPEAVIAIGGPVPEEAALAAEGLTPIADGLVAVDLGADPTLVRAGGVTRLRVFAGYAGWGPGQLEGELEAGGWFVVDAEADDPFDPDPADLWARVLGRQPGRLRIFAHCPPDPSVN
jgi:putative transcriptional regulator